MANKKLGYIPLYRSIQDHWLWNNSEPFSKGQAWIDLLLLANHETKKKQLRNGVITIKPGQKWTSYDHLAERWGWTRKRVYRFINLLKSDGMVTTDSNTSGTLVTIVNWENFQLRGNTDDPTHDTTDDTSGDSTHDPTHDTRTINKELNNDKELKKEGRAPAPPSGGGQWQ